MHVLAGFKETVLIREGEGKEKKGRGGDGREEGTEGDGEERTGKRLEGNIDVPPRSRSTGAGDSAALPNV